VEGDGGRRVEEAGEAPPTGNVGWGQGEASTLRARWCRLGASKDGDRGLRLLYQRGGFGFGFGWLVADWPAGIPAWRGRASDTGCSHGCDSRCPDKITAVAGHDFLLFFFAVG